MKTEVMRLYLLCMCILAACPMYLWGQQNTKQVKGTVIDTDGHPLANATVQTAVSKRTVLTDDRGSFELMISEEDTLSISRVGYKSLTYVVENESDFRLVLEKADFVIEEVVVSTGYQELKPNEVNGSVTVVGREMLELQNGTNILERLNGVTNGLTFPKGKQNSNPQNELGITIRGYSTINGPLDPLVVLDNFVYEGDIDNINPNDVESITILKDAEATSIYGARGGNGVIVITTKKTNVLDKADVSVNSVWKVIEQPDLSSLQFMNNSDYIEVEEMLFKEGFFDNELTSFSAPPVTPIVFLLEQRRKETLSDEEYLKYRSFYINSDFRDQYKKAFFNNGVTHQLNANISGRTSFNSWVVSAGDYKSKNELSVPSNRTNFRLDNTFHLYDWVKFQVSGSYVNRKQQNGQISTLNELMRVGSRQLVPYMSFYSIEGEELPFYQTYSKSLLDTIGGGVLKDWLFYPLQEQNYRSSIANTTELIGNVGAEIKIVKNFKLGIYYQKQQQKTDVENLYQKESFHVRNMVNAFSQIDYTNKKVDYVVPFGDVLEQSYSIQTSESFRSQVDFKRYIKDHDILVMTGFEAREVQRKAKGSTYYGYNEDPLSVIPVDYVNQFVTLPFGRYQSIGGSPIIRPSNINRFVSLYGNFYYAYKGRYSVSGNIRRDGSNIYGVSTNDKWKPLWSIGMGYDLIKEGFMKRSVFKKMKFKSTIGYSGNVDLSRSALPIAAYSNNSIALGGYPFVRITTLNNPSLKWEEVRQYNFGAELELSSLPLSITFEYYTKYGTDLYGLSEYDYTTGGVSPTIVRNVAAMRGKGIDLEINNRFLREHFSWTTSIIYNYNISKTSDYYDPSNVNDVYKLVNSNGSQITPIVGFPLYSLAAFRWKGLDEEGNPQGLINGSISTDYVTMQNISAVEGIEGGSIRYIGSALPTHFGSWMNDFKYKNWSLNFNMTFKLGYYFRRPSISYSALVNYGAGHSDFSNRWQKDEDNTNVPSFKYPLEEQGRDSFYLSSDVLIESASHIRLQFINLMYDLTTSIKGINKCRLFLNSSNLGVVWKASKHIQDPEYPNGIPPQRSFAFGITVTL